MVLRKDNLLMQSGDDLLLQDSGLILLGPIITESTISVGTGTVGTRFIRTDWPITEGLIGGTTRQVGNPNL